MAIQPIKTLELRGEKIPRNPLVEVIERDTGRTLREEFRHYLENRPVHCGDFLELYQNGRWVEGRYEWSGGEEDPPSFHMSEEAITLDTSSLLRWPNP